MSLLRLGTKATLPDSPDGLRRSANLYFCISALACLGSVLLYSVVLPRLGSVRRRREAALAAALHNYGPLPEAAAAAGGEAMQPTGQAGLKARQPATADASHEQQGGVDLELSGEDGSSACQWNGLQQEEQQAEHAPLLDEQRGTQSCGAGSSLTLLRHMWRLALANGLVFV